MPFKPCPECNGRMILDMKNRRRLCGSCGHTEPQERPSLTPDTLPSEPRGETQNRSFNHFEALTLVRSGNRWLKQGQKSRALRDFRLALKHDPDLVAAHYAIAKLIPDRESKIYHLRVVLDNDPNHVDAHRRLAVLEGRMTLKQAARLYNVGSVKVADEPLRPQTTVVRCPVCDSGGLRTDEDGSVRCQFCGYKAESKPATSSEGHALTAALRAQSESTYWIFGERLLHCNNCGAERPMPEERLSHQCPFCGSNHVIESYAQGQFRKPDGLVPFTVTEDEAHAAVFASLNTVTERLLNFFTVRDVKQNTFAGVYMPFWVFEGMVREALRNYVGDVVLCIGAGTENYFKRYDLAVPGVESPPVDLINKLGRYNLDTLRDYEPRLITNYVAELYSVTFDEASMTAAGVVSNGQRKRDYATKVPSMTHSMTDPNSWYQQQKPEPTPQFTFGTATAMGSPFRLILLPVWIATLIEADGDLRTALVNGQTGHTVLGKPRKA